MGLLFLTWVDVMTFVGSFGLFFTLFLLFLKFLPMISISEVKSVMDIADPHHYEPHSKEKHKMKLVGYLCQVENPYELLELSKKVKDSGYTRFDT